MIARWLAWWLHECVLAVVAKSRRIAGAHYDAEDKG